MSRRHPTTLSGGKKAAAAAQPDIAKQLRIVVAVSVLVAASVGVMIAWEHWFPVPPEQLVKVYRVHGCRCVFEWVKSLEADGFKVKMQEVQTLAHVRAALHTPTDLHGCHVAEHLGYFVEGHVSSIALRKLAREHPNGLGVVTQATVTATAAHVSAYRDEKSPVLLIGNRGQSQLWFEPGG